MQLPKANGLIGQKGKIHAKQGAINTCMAKKQ